MNTFLSKSTFAVLPLFLIAACGGDDESDLFSLDGAKYAVVSAGTLQHNTTSIAGSGSVVFNDPLPALTSKRSFQLVFALADGGSLTLVSNGSTALETGVGVKMTRDGTVLRVVLSASGLTNDVTGAFSGVDASGTIAVVVDVHNDEEPAHLLAWTGSDFDEGAAVLNSEEAGRETPGNGSGTYWGLILDNATVETASVGDAKFVEGA